VGYGTRRKGVGALRIAALLLLARRTRINELIVVHGRFVMNTETEVVEAVADLTSGKFGVIAH
jgi:redox-sensitive bicupin YhaK (pirin superfamily)